MIDPQNISLSVPAVISQFCLDKLPKFPVLCNNGRHQKLVLFWVWPPHQFQMGKLCLISQSSSWKIPNPSSLYPKGKRVHTRVNCTAACKTFHKTEFAGEAQQVNPFPSYEFSSYFVLNFLKSSQAFEPGFHTALVKSLLCCGCQNTSSCWLQSAW